MLERGLQNERIGSKSIQMNSETDRGALLAAIGVQESALLPSQSADGRITRRVIYTAILAGSDTLNKPLYEDNSCDYICFTDSAELTSKFWRIVRVAPDAGANLYMVAKALKVLGADILSGYDQSMWVDGNVLLKRDPWLLVSQKVGVCDFAFMKHPNRNCVFQEIEACAHQGKDNKSNLERVRSRLVEAGYPENSGLIWGGMIFRTHQAHVKQLFREWMRNINEFSRRDQLTFNYTCWRSQILINYVDIDIYNNRYFSVLPHFSTAIEKLKWIRKYFLVWCGEKFGQPV